MSDDPSSESDTRYEMGVSHNTTVYAVGGPATTPPSLSNFTLPDPSSVPPVIDDTDRGQQTDTLASNIEEVTQAIEGEHADLLTGPERESKTYGRFKNCDICQVVMNSAAQAEMHYGGKTHQKKLRRIAEMKGKLDNAFWKYVPKGVPTNSSYTYKIARFTITILMHFISALVIGPIIVAQP